MEVFEVDERDSSWENDCPRFRVYLHGSGPDATHGWTSTHDLTDCDLLQALDWAQREAAGRLTYAIALVVDDAELARHDPEHGRGLVWLIGRDGNDDPGDADTRDLRLADAQRRMLARRRDPVGVPVADRC